MADEYIHKQNAIDKINERQRKLIYCFGFENDAVKIMDIAKSIIIAIPAADVAPVVHGKWIDHDGNKVQLNEHGETCGTCFCSRCGEWLVASDEYAVKGYFCPNCGAKMDEEE